MRGQQNFPKDARSLAVDTNRVKVASCVNLDFSGLILLFPSPEWKCLTQCRIWADLAGKTYFSA